MTTSFVKCGMQGGTGTGKSTTAGLLLLGLSVEYANKAPVLAYDTEPGWQFLKSLFEAEGIELIIRNGRSFKGMHEALKEAVKLGCCGFAVDSITHGWQELLERFADSTGRVPFHKFNQIKPLWNEWTVDFLNAPLHAVANGRLAFEYLYETAEDGRKDLVKGDAKMKAGGGESFGYEPHCCCEMSHQRKKLASGKLGGMEYTCLVLKDRSRALNGREFVFQDIGQYKPGGYKIVLNAFRPHVEAILGIVGAEMPKSTSAALVPDGNSDYYRQQKLRQVALEEWDAVMDKLWPSTKATDKKARGIAGEMITGTLSRTKFEQYDLPKIQEAVAVLMTLERILTWQGLPNMETNGVEVLTAQIAKAREEFLSAAEEKGR